MDKIQEIIDWGKISYDEAWDKQRLIFDKAIEKKTKGEQPTNTLILCEHPHVITLGKSGNEHNLLLPEKFLKDKGVEFFHIDRGGDITYHGPGQLVVYPIFDLEQFGIGLKEYIHRMEETVIKTVADYGITADRFENATGVWLDIDNSKARKICAIGVKSSRYVTMHGLALNVNTDLSYFSLINPCGFTEKGVTSIQKENNGEIISMEEVKQKMIDNFRKIFI